MSKILLIEDSLSQLALMNLYLRDSDHRIINLTNPKEALNKAVFYQPHVIVTDLIMPEMNGFEVCRQLKKHPDTQDIPIVICSAKNHEIDRIWGMKQGATAHLSKPFSRDQLIQTINKARLSSPKNYQQYRLRELIEIYPLEWGNMANVC
ncbi:response regulator [Coleofasciculus sp.]|uniref:response regulator n=1 Tax=Coleofasciculus sp. TaxID=3100458 RepID=UPI0039F9698B